MERSPQVHRFVFCILGIDQRPRKNAEGQSARSVQSARDLTSLFFQGRLARTLLVSPSTQVQLGIVGIEKRPVCLVAGLIDLTSPQLV